MREGIENVLTQLFTELDNFFLVATWAEPASSTGEGQQVFMMAVGASHTGESLRQVTTPEIVPNHMGDYLPIETVALCKTLWIDILKVIETLRKQFIE
jgi:hypothetical protein